MQNHYIVHLKLMQYCKSSILQLKKKETTEALLENYSRQKER